MMFTKLKDILSLCSERAEDILAAVNSRFTRFAQFGTDFWAAKKKNLKDEIIERTDLMEMIYDN